MKKSILILPLVLLLLLTACGIPNNEIVSSQAVYEASSQEILSSSGEAFSTDKQQETLIPVEETIQKQLSENLRVDAKAVYLPVSSVNILGVNGLAFDINNVKLLLLKDTQITDQNNNEDSTYFITKSENLFLDNSGIHYASNRSDTISSVFIYNKSNPFYNYDAYQQSDLSFMSAAEAFKKVKQALSELGILVDEGYDYRTLDIKTLKDQEQALKNSADPNKAYLFQGKNGKPYQNVSAEHESYFFSLRMTENGIPVCKDDVGGFETSPMGGTVLETIYSANGFEYLSARGIYAASGIYKESVPIISVDEAIDSVKEKYSTVILTGDTVIKSISLEYLLSPGEGGFKNLLKPVWAFEVEQHGTQLNKQTKKQDEYTSQSYTLIDATSGKEIV